MLRYLSTAVLARLPDEGARVALILLALDRTGSARLGGELVAALLVPHVLAAPVAGAVADRARHRRAVQALSLTGYGAALAGCALLTGRAPAALVLGVAVAGGCLAPMVTGGLTSLLTDLVPADRLTRAYALDVASYNVAGIAGPAAAGLLAALAGPPGATLALAASLVAAAALLTGLPIRPGAAAGPDRPPLTAGVTAVYRSRPLLAVTTATAVAQAGIGALPLVAALLAQRYHAASGAGLPLAAFAAGGLLGSLGYARRPVGRDRPQWVALLTMAAVAVPLALVPLVHPAVAVLALFAVAGVWVGPQASAVFAIRERYAPSGARTQVFTVGAGVKLTAAALGAALAAGYAHAGPYALVVAVAAAQVAGATAGALLLGRRGRRGAPAALAVRAQ
jgi:predicted MFS family arabinose efflux permease